MVGLFAGVGMIEHACRALGGEATCLVESDEFCRRVLAKRYLGVPVHHDVRDFGRDSFTGDCDLLCGGFPCQNLSSAGNGEGLDGAKSGLWREFARIIGELHPSMVLVENVALLRRRGLDRLLLDLLCAGYVAEWDVVSAAAVGARHLRERIWIVARLPEVAQGPVYGARTGESSVLWGGGVLPRAGSMGLDGRVHDLVPLAPRKTKRRDGWTYWVGVDLLAESGDAQMMWPTPRAEERMQVNSRDSYVSLSKKVSVIARGGELLTLSDVAYGALWPSSSSRDYKDVGDLTCVPDNGLLPRRVFRVEEGLWPTPKVNDGDGRAGQAKRIEQGRSNLTDRMEVEEPRRSASLSPNWVEWLMAMPLWWTDPDFTFPTQVPWRYEPDLALIPRTAHGVPQRAKRLRAIGNSICWPCAYYVMRRALTATPGIDREELLLAA